MIVASVSVAEGDANSPTAWCRARSAALASLKRDADSLLPITMEIQGGKDLVKILFET